MASKQTVADMLMERLIGWGVDTIFGYPGDGVNGLFEGLRTHQKGIKFIQVRRTTPGVVAKSNDDAEPTT